RQATINRRLGREEAALRLYLAAVKRDKDLALELADYYRELLRDDDAAEWYKQIPQNSALFAEAQSRLEQLEIEREARRYGWSPTHRAVSQRVRNVVRRAEALLGRGQIAGAEELARSAAEENPQYGEAHRVHGDALAALGKSELALNTWLRGVVVEPNNAELIRRIALAYRDTDRNVEAIVLIGRALQLRPDWTELRLDLALALRESGDLPGAFREVSRFLDAEQQQPRRDEATQLQGELSALLKTTPEATEAEPEQNIGSFPPSSRARTMSLSASASPASLPCSVSTSTRFTCATSRSGESSI
ncbi:MAG: hypothetical protein AAFX94_25090, partial [Myxococcota bacterium]